MREEKLNTDGKDCAEFHRRYFVGDWVLDKNEIRLVLLLESPYLAELAHRHPLAGGAGRSVASHFRQWFKGLDCNFRSLNPDDIPFGCQLRSSECKEVGIVNCWNYPLDMSAYCVDDDCIDVEKIRAWDDLRREINRGKKLNYPFQGVAQEIAADLERRLTPFLAGELQHVSADAIIPCGRFARTMLAACLSTPITNLIDVPHPSMGNWKRKCYRTKVTALETIVKEKLVSRHHG